MPRSLLSLILDPLTAIFSALITLPVVYLFLDDRRYFEACLIAHFIWLSLVLLKSYRRPEQQSETQIAEPVKPPSDFNIPAEANLPEPEVPAPVPSSPAERIMERVKTRLQALELPSEMEELLSSYFRLAVKAELNLVALKPSVEIAATKCEAVQQQVISVEKIALETKLLALNDAFDAAASNESGRGFGMVAKEVGRVSHSASRVSEAIELEMSAISGTSKQLVVELDKLCFHSLAYCYQNDSEIRHGIHQIETASKKLKQQLSRAVTLLSEDRQSAGSFTQNRTDPVVGTVVSQLQEDISAMLEALERINADLLALHLHPLRLLPDVGRLKTIVDAVVEETGLE